jgi:tripartite-type tricarboxylate transporter receptor subunit TctC
MKHWLKIASAALALISMPGLAAAEYPERPISFYIGQTAGGASDIQARLLAKFLEKYLPGDAPITIVNQVGAGGALAFTTIAQAASDGYTLGYVNAPPVITQVIEEKVNFTLKDFSYIGQIFSGQASLVVGPQSPFKTLADMVAFSKENPKALTVAIGTVGGDDHLLALRFMRLAGAEFTIIPMGDDARARNAVMGGHVGVGSMSLLAASGFRDKLRPLGTMAMERMDFASDVPTFREQGFDIVGGARRIFVGPAGLPQDVMHALSTAVEKTIADPEFQAEAKKTFSFVDHLDPGQTAQMIEDEHKILTELWKDAPWAE